MATLTVFYIKLIISVGLTGCIFFLTTIEKELRKLQTGASDQVILALGIILFRLIPWYIVFNLLGEAPRGDVPFFFSKGVTALEGGLVYRDFWSFHAPLFSYILAIPVYLWRDPKVVVLFMIFVEAGVLYATYYYYKSSKPYALLASLIYLLLPASFMYIALGGQEEIWFWGFTVLMLFSLRKKPAKYEMRLGLLFGLAVLTTKASFIFFLIPTILLVKRPIIFIVTLLAIGLPVTAGLFLLMDWHFLMPLRHADLIMAPNLFSVARPFIELVVKINEAHFRALNFSGMVLTIFFSSIFALRLRKIDISRSLPLVFIVSFTCMEIFQLSAPGAYVVAFLMALVFELVDFKNSLQMGLLLLLSWLTVVQPFVYVYSGQPQFISFAMLNNPKFLLEWVLELLNVSCFITILWLVNNKVVALSKLS